MWMCIRDFIDIDVSSWSYVIYLQHMSLHGAVDWDSSATSCRCWNLCQFELCLSWLFDCTRYHTVVSILRYFCGCKCAYAIVWSFFSIVLCFCYMFVILRSTVVLCMHNGVLLPSSGWLAMVSLFSLCYVCPKRAMCNCLETDQTVPLSIITTLDR